MRDGDFAAAWAISDRILRERDESEAANSARPRHLQYLWDGRSLDGQRVLVHCYHGLGDTLQFVRLLPLLRARAREVILWVQPQLLGLLHGFPGVDRMEALHDGAPGFARDADIELMELPHWLRLTQSTIPNRVPYLRMAPAPARMRGRSDRRRVGIVWRAGDWDASRSIPASLLAPLREVAGVRWLSLQFGGAKACPLPAIDFACADLREQARRMCGLDLIICVDTLVAHLAGALGQHTWLLLPEPCDWRWMSARADSPWYPTLRLFRQQRAGDWRTVIDEVRAALVQWLQEMEDRHAESHVCPQLAAG